MNRRYHDPMPSMALSESPQEIEVVPVLDHPAVLVEDEFGGAFDRRELPASR